MGSLCPLSLPLSHFPPTFRQGNKYASGYIESIADCTVRSQLFAITALSGLGFLLGMWYTPMAYDQSALVFLWVSWFCITVSAMLYNGQAYPLTALLCAFWLMVVLGFICSSTWPQFQAFLLVFWVITSMGFLNSNIDL
jgi:hypothetical protein